ncbi:MAG: gliding motility-associated-like protein [Bacteroidia bacterium]
MQFLPFEMRSMKRILPNRICSIISTLVLTFAATAAFATTWYANELDGDDTNDGLSATVQTGGVGPFETIQMAMASATANDTIQVAYGDYYGQLIIDKPIVIIGNKASVAGSNSRGLESILLPAVSELSPGVNPVNSLVTILSSDVQIWGMRFDGDNTNVDSDNDLNGRDPDITNGLSVFGSFNNIQCINNVFENFSSNGANFIGIKTSINAACIFQGNMLQNFRGTALTLSNGFYMHLESNRTQFSTDGISISNFNQGDAPPWVITANELFVDNQALSINSYTGSASDLFIRFNTFGSNQANYAGVGLALNGCKGQRITLENNVIKNFVDGIFMIANQLEALSSNQDTIDGCDYGVRRLGVVINKQVDTFFFTGSYFTGINSNAIEIGADSNEAYLELKDCVIKNSSNGVVAKGNTTLVPNNTSFQNIQSYYLQIDDANRNILTTKEVNARMCVFDGVMGSTATDRENFVIEDKIKHFLDDNRFAFAIFKDKTIYITTRDNNFWITPAFSKATDGWDVHVDAGIYPEDVMITKSIHFYTHGLVQVRSFIMNALGKTFYFHDTITLANTITLLNGIINTEDAEVIVGQNGFFEPFTKVSNGSPFSYIEGPLTIVEQTSSRDTLSFPLGRNGNFRPLTVVMEGSTTGQFGRIRAQLRSGPGPNFDLDQNITHISEVEHWRIQNIDAINFDKVQYLGLYATTAINDEVSQPTFLNLAIENNNSWQNIGGVGSAAGNGFIVSTIDQSAVSYLSLANTVGGKNRLGKAGPIASFGYDDPCFGDSVQFTNTSFDDVGETIVDYFWDFGDMTATNDTSHLGAPKFVFLAPGMYQVSLVVFSSNGNTDTMIRTIEIDPPALAGFQDQMNCNPILCFFTDTSQTLADDPTVMRFWSMDGATYNGQNISHAFTTTGFFDVQLRIVSQKGCEDSTTRTVYYGDSVNISITPSGPITLCTGDSIILRASAGSNTYAWSNGATTDSIVVYTGGMYIVTGYNGSNCFESDTAQVVFTPAPVAFAGVDATITFGDSLLLQGTGGTSYAWSPVLYLSTPNAQNTIAKPKKTTSFVLRVTNTFGCEDYDTVLVTVNIPTNLIVPNLISPNGDNVNDAWDLTTLPDLENTKVSVLNRWGKLVYSSNNYLNDWEGTYEGNPLPDGTYIYIIENEPTFGVLKGSLQIVR